MNSSRSIPTCLVAVYAALCCLFVANGCTSATLTNTWRNPAFTRQIDFKKTVALVIYKDGTVRRTAEDEIVNQIGAERAVAGYTLLTEDERQDINKLRAKLESSGIDGAVTMKLVGKRQETTYVPGSAGYGSFYDYYGVSGIGSPGYVVTDTIATVETKIYSVKDGMLIWSATSDTFNPSDVRSNIADIAKAVGEELRKEKLLPPKKSG